MNLSDDEKERDPQLLAAAGVSLQTSEEQYRRLVEDMPVFIATFLPDGTLTYTNDALVTCVDLPGSKLVGQNFYEFLSADDREMVRARLALLTPEQPVETHEQRYRIPGEMDTYHQWTNRAFFDPAGKVIGFQTIGQDITERKQIELALQQKAHYQRALLDNFPFAVWLKDNESCFLSVNMGFARTFGANNPDELIGKNDFDIAPRDLAEGYRADDRAVLASCQKQNVEEEILTEGIRKWFETYKAPVIDDNGEVIGTVGFARDITERKQMEDQVRQLAFHDPLTQLPNRRLLNDRLSQAMAASARSACHGAVMFLDLDNFKLLNDMHGHMVGDLLLIQAADRLKSCVRETDTVARFGGDEFVVMISELEVDKAESIAQVRIIAEKICNTLSEPYLLTFKCEGKAEMTIAHHCTASIGVALFINHEVSQENILKWADAAMYQAKEAGRNLVQFYDPNASSG